MKLLVCLLCLATAAFGAATPAVEGVVAGEVAIDERLIDVLGGLDEVQVRDELEQILRQGGALATAETPGRHRDEVSVAIRGWRTSRSSCVYSITVALNRLSWDPVAGHEVKKPVAQRVISGTTSSSALSIQVIVTLEEQTAALLAGPKTAQRPRMRVATASGVRLQ